MIKKPVTGRDLLTRHDHLVEEITIRRSPGMALFTIGSRAGGASVEDPPSLTTTFLVRGSEYEALRNKTLAEIAGAYLDTSAWPRPVTEALGRITLEMVIAGEAEAYAQQPTSRDTEGNPTPFASSP